MLLGGPTIVATFKSLCDRFACQEPLQRHFWGQPGASPGRLPLEVPAGRLTCTLAHLLKGIVKGCMPASEQRWRTSGQPPPS